MSGAQRAGAVPFHKRLSVRLAILFALAMIASHWLIPYVTKRVAGWLDLDVDRPFVVAYDDDEMLGPSLDFSACSVPADVARAVHEVDRMDGEAWQRLAKGVAEWTCATGSVFVVTGPDLVTIVSTTPHQHAPGRDFDPGERLGPVVEYHPIRSESGDVRWLCLLPPVVPLGIGKSDESSEGAGDSRIDPWNHEFSAGDLELPDGLFDFPGDAIVATEEEIERRFSRFNVLAIAVSWALPLAGALLLGVVISWFVTRRIVRLSQAAADPSIDSFERFETDGGDEISGLGAALAEAHRNVAGLVREVEGKDTQRREWFAQVSHDIRTPLTALSACLERAGPIAMEIESVGTRGRLEKILAVARDDTQRVHALTSHLLEVARLELPGALDVEALLPNEFVERAVTMLGPLAEREGKLLTFVPSDSQSLVSGDGNRLMRALENLIRNAIEHATRMIEVTVSDSSEGIVISVEDDGPGFRKQANGEVNTDRLGRARADSAGLGLVVVQRVLEAHGSILELGQSSAGGAAARFRLASANSLAETD